MSVARAFSGVLAVASLVCGLLYAVSYLGQPQLVRNPRPAGVQESLVAVIENFGPVWPIMFVISAAAIIASAAFPHRRSLVIAHMVGVLSWLFYGSSIIAGALLQVPPVPILHGSMSLVFPPLHIICVLVWLTEFDRARATPSPRPVEQEAEV